MGGGNGQKSQTARERKMKAMESAAAGSQLKSNEAAKTVQCKVCFQSFLCTIRHAQLRDHVENRHSGRTFEEAFPNLPPETEEASSSSGKKAKK